MDMIPGSFEEWRICIEDKCGIPLTSEFAEKRMTVYKNESTAETKRFIGLYGQKHLENIKQWFTQIIEEKSRKVI